MTAAQPATTYNVPRKTPLLNQLKPVSDEHMDLLHYGCSNAQVQYSTMAITGKVKDAAIIDKFMTIS